MRNRWLWALVPSCAAWAAFLTFSFTSAARAGAGLSLFEYLMGFVFITPPALITAACIWAMIAIAQDVRALWVEQHDRRSSYFAIGWVVAGTVLTIAFCGWLIAGIGENDLAPPLFRIILASLACMPLVLFSGLAISRGAIDKATQSDGHDEGPQL